MVDNLLIGPTNRHLTQQFGAQTIANMQLALSLGRNTPAGRKAAARATTLLEERTEEIVRGDINRAKTRGNNAIDVEEANEKGENAFKKARQRGH